MGSLVLIAIQLVVPLLLLALATLLPVRSRLGWWIRSMLAALYLLAIAMAGLWLVLPWHLPIVFGGLLAIGLAHSYRRGRGAPAFPRAIAGWAGIGLGLLGVVLVSLQVSTAYAGRRVAGTPIDLAFPLANGTYLVANGGSRELINSHLMALPQEREAEYSGMRAGIDLVRIDRWGRRSIAGMTPPDPATYLIFGDNITAPCDGSVVVAVDGLVDLSPPATDREHMAGNHVIIECAGAWVVLAHMQRGTVEVHHGDAVAVGQTIGRVGNSGNTTEPHLHIHAQRPGTFDRPLGGEPIPMRFGGRALWRNAKIVA